MRWEARRNLHKAVYRESHPLTVQRAARALFKRQMFTFEEPSNEIADQMWRDHVFLTNRRIAILLSVHPRVGQDSSMRKLGLDMLHVIIEITDPWIDALTSKSRAAAVLAADPLTALLDGPSNASATLKGNGQARHHDAGAGPPAGGFLLPPSAILGLGADSWWLQANPLRSYSNPRSLRTTVLPLWFGKLPQEVLTERRAAAVVARGSAQPAQRRQPPRTRVLGGSTRISRQQVILWQWLLFLAIASGTYLTYRSLQAP